MGRNSEDTARLLCTIAGSTAAEPVSLRDDLPEADAFDARRLPVVNVPVGSDGRGRPMGMQIWGRLAKTGACSSSRWRTKKSRHISMFGPNSSPKHRNATSVPFLWGSRPTREIFLGFERIPENHPNHKSHETHVGVGARDDGSRSVRWKLKPRSRITGSVLPSVVNGINVIRDLVP